MQSLRLRLFMCGPLLLASASSGAAQREAMQTRPKLDFTPFTGERSPRRTELIPVLAGEQVLVTTTLRLFAFDALTAELRWSVGPPQGWAELEPAARDELFDGLDMRRLWIAPATGERVAVAALQIPQSRSPREEWQGIHISTPLPERRLFACELASGQELWNHAPPADWDGAGGPFAQSMSLCASPTIIGSCVLVPCISDASSVDYHVASYELTRGALLWSTFVVRGQIERNSFGKAPFEFTGAPLVGVPGRGRVLVQTGLGLIAALDLATGEVLWRTEYEPIELPNVRSYTPPRREVVWRTTPPIVVGDVVLATPPDSRELLALDLEDGHVLWSVSVSVLNALHTRTNELAFDHLIGVDGEMLYLGGAKVSALVKRRGLRSAETLEPLWTERVSRPETSGRACLAGDALLLPGPVEWLTLDRETGKERNSREVSGTHGLLVTDEALYVLTEDGLKRIDR